MKTWKKPELTALDVDQTLYASKRDYTENHRNIITFILTFKGDKPGGS